MGKNLIMAILLFASFSGLFGQKTSQAAHAVTVGYFNDKFGSHGMRLGYEYPVWQKAGAASQQTVLKHAFILKANINFYHHQRHHVGLLANISIGYRYTSNFGLIVEPLHLGTGYLHSFLDGKTYTVNDNGSFDQAKLASNASFVLPYIQLLGIGYDFRQKSNLPLSFMVSLDPYIQHSVNTQSRVRLATPISLTYFFQ